MKSTLFALLTCGSFIPAAFGQIGGTGWTPQPLTFNVQWPYNTNQSSRYTLSNGVYHCLVYSNDAPFKVGSTTLPRTEQRFTPDYTNGEIQYQSTMMASSNENSYCVFQIHTGDAQSATFGSTTFMLFWFSSNGGSVHDYSGTELANHLSNQWFQLNVDHNLVTRTIKVWINQKLVWTQQDNGAGDFYFKDGVYMQDHGATLQMDTWITNNIQIWTSSGAAVAVSCAPSAITVNPGGGSTSTVNVAGFANNVSLSVNGLPAGATATLNPATITGGSGSSTLTLTTTATLATGSYLLTINATDGMTNMITALNLGVMPIPWADQDIGGPGQSGGASYSNGVFSVSGAGADVWGTSDQFNYAYQNLSGDMTISARVDSQQNTDPWAKSGLMIRETTDPNSKYVFLFVTPATSHGVDLQYRGSTGSNAVDTVRLNGPATPYWLRLTRSGDNFSGYASSDGLNWTLVTNVTVSMASGVAAGLAVCSHTNTALNATAFSNVALPASQPVIKSLTTLAGGGLAISGSKGNPNGYYYVLAGTNLGVPLSNWMRVATNAFDINGNFSSTNAMDSSLPQEYYLLQLP